MFPYFTPQNMAYYQQPGVGNQYWMIPQQGVQLQPNMSNLPQYGQNFYLGYNNYSEQFRPLNHSVSNIPVAQRVQQIKKGFSCNCVNTDCRKQYCICFKNGEICGEKCGCTSCRNKQQCQRSFALQKKKNLTCNCKKSQCAKKYCECYANGIKCGEACNCLDCKNV